MAEVDKRGSHRLWGKFPVLDKHAPTTQGCLILMDPELFVQGPACTAQRQRPVQCRFVARNQICKVAAEGSRAGAVPLHALCNYKVIKPMPSL